MPAKKKTQGPEVIICDKDVDGVSCDGGGGALGHPKVWYSFDGQDNVECGYCDRLFTKTGTKGKKA
ncbi:MAG: zinc-finger domain-containing protein [Alphaproteobacteria bacterium]|nr:zinc-finger domain-containing protein [Alphaproteobacteria bacterium]